MIKSHSFINEHGANSGRQVFDKLFLKGCLPELLAHRTRPRHKKARADLGGDYSPPPPKAAAYFTEHSNSRFVMRIDSFSKKNRPFDSLVVMQFFLFIYCIVSAKK